MATEVGTGALHRAVEHRASLRSALHELEAALAAPVPGRVEAWRARLNMALDGLSDAFRAHVRETESPEGLLADIGRDAPRLIHAVAQAREEHASLEIALEGAGEVVEGGPPAQVREELMHLCLRLSRHRQLGSDLVYEAYSVDIGTGAD